MAKKSLFEKLGLVESEGEMGQYPSSTDLNPDDAGNFFQTPLVQAEVPAGDILDVSAVYDANDMDPADKVTVYKIQDMLASLPAEMPSKTKKTTIKSLMTTLGYNAADIQADAAQRIELLKTVGNDKANALFDEMNQNDGQIESMKEDIERLTNRNAEANAAIEKMSDVVKNEVKTIEDVLEYVKEDS